MNHSIHIDENLCVGCGLCSKDCVATNIEIKEGKAKTIKDSCIFCGHCQAICPQNAVTITGFEDDIEEFEEATRLDPDTLLKAIKTRRTIRNFKNKEIPKKVLHQIIEAGRLAPTAVNSQNISYIILDKKRKTVEAMAIGTIRKLMNMAKPVVPFLKEMKIDDDFLFKKAPIVIMIMSKDKVSASLAAENMAFMAEANGLGVLFSGFFTICANTSGKIRRYLKMKKGQKVVTTLVIGYPNVKYYRTAHREKADVRYL